MRSLSCLAWRMLVEGRNKALLSVLGVALAVALVTSLYILFGKLEQAAQVERFEAYGDVDIRVGFRGGRTFSGAEEEQISRLTGIKESNKIWIGSGGNQGGSRRTSARDVSYMVVGVEEGKLAKQLYKLSTPMNTGEVLITANLAEHLNARMKEDVSLILSNGEETVWKVGGIVPSVQAAAAPSMVFIRLEELQEVMKPDVLSFHVMLLELEEGVEPIQMANQLRELQIEGLEIELISENDLVRKNRQSIQVMGYSLGVLALLTSTLFIQSNFQIMLRQNQRDYAMLRAIGCTPRQCFQLVLLQGLWVILMGVASGMLLGSVLTDLLSSTISSWLGEELAETPVEWDGILGISLSSSLFILAALFIPARQSMGIPPMEAIRGSGTDEGLTNRGKWSFGAIIGIMILVLGATGFGFGLIAEDNAGRAGFVILGGLLLVLGCYGLFSLLAKPLLTMSLTLVERMAGREAYVALKHLIPQSKHHTLVTMAVASSLTIAVAGTTILGSLSSGIERSLYDEYLTDYVVTSRSGTFNQMTYTDAKLLGEALSSAGAVIPVSDKGFVDLPLTDNLWNSDRLNFMMTDFNQLEREGYIPKLEGDPAQAAILSTAYARTLGTQEGDVIRYVRQEIGQADRAGELKVVAILDVLPGASHHSNTALVDGSNQTLFDSRLQLDRILIQAKDGGGELLLTQLDEARLTYPELQWASLEDARADLQQQVKQRNILLTVVVGIILLVGMFGLATSLGSAIYAHRREFAILRAISLTKEQLSKVILVQSLSTVSLALVLGVGSGMIMSISMMVGLDGDTMIDWWTVALMGAIILLLAVGITYPMARRLGRLSISDELNNQVL